MPFDRNLIPPAYKKNGYFFTICIDLERKMYYSNIFDQYGVPDKETHLRETPEQARDDAIDYIKERSK